MRSEFQHALDAASQRDDPASRISIIKRAVAAEITSVDPTARPSFTDYFNHTLVPDIVLQWPSEGRERFLFVRQTGDANWLLNDLPYVSEHRPMMFTLEDLNATNGDPSRSAWESLGQKAAEAGTWIADSSATQIMSDVRAHNPVLGMLSQALVRGGRGVADGSEIRSLATATESGFAGAARGAAPPTRSAVEAIEAHLDDEQSGRLTRLMRAIWGAKAGDEAAFPATSTVKPFAADDLTYLLRSTGDESADFWAWIGRALRTEMFRDVRVDDPSPNLQALVSANLDTLQAKGIRLAFQPHQLTEPDEFPRWIVSANCLALRGGNWTAYVAARLKADLPAVEESGDLPNLARLRRRAADSRTRINTVRLAGHDRTVTYEATEGSHILDDAWLSKIAADFDPAASLDRAVVTLPAGGSVELEFPPRTASGPGNVTYLLGPLLRSALPLLFDFPPDELRGLRSFLRTTVEPEQVPLFELDSEGAEMELSDPPDNVDL